MELKPFFHFFFIQLQKQKAELIQTEKMNRNLLELMIISFKNLKEHIWYCASWQHDLMQPFLRACTCQSQNPVQRTDMQCKCIGKKKGCWHRQNGYMNDVHDPNIRFIYASILESGQATVAAAGVGAVVPHIFPSARQQEQEQAADLLTASLWLCIPAQPFSDSHLQSCKI